MIFQGNAFSIKRLDGPDNQDLAELTIDTKNESVNKFDTRTIDELGQALDALEKEKNIKGLIMTSGKPVFIVGADITEFTTLFFRPDADIAAYLTKPTRLSAALKMHLTRPSLPLMAMHSAAVLKSAWPLITALWRTVPVSVCRRPNSVYSRLWRNLSSAAHHRY